MILSCPAHPIRGTTRKGEQAFWRVFVNLASLGAGHEQIKAGRILRFIPEHLDPEAHPKDAFSSRDS